ncbi:MAG TPA: cobalamin-binding protein [Hypericibacter adhaerens]|jgi:iron complex transport system substrate-binding protein|uniref:cobalamin-binding protein n=1 Tax=Hypericibacter adhaerens TaxID=2602016 RepID=UPI002CA3047F|nr:cobalamin-binding protein [Hypericibacter adhaerens]HWA43267.1 cobalamin-binding protein [Hypericibacter adhaerens]
MFPPERIVCLTEETVETLYLLGEQDRIVGISGYVVRPPEARRDKPRVSAFTSARIDRILALKPDLVLTFSDLQAEIAAELIRHGIAVHGFNQRDVAGILAMIRMLGAMVGQGDKGARLADRLTARLEEIRRRAGRLSPRPRVYFEEWDEPMIPGIGWVSELIGIAGGIDVFADRATQAAAKDRIVAAEAVIAARPDIILASWCGKKVAIPKIASRAGWDAIPAVARGRIHEIKSSLILQPGPAALTDGLDAIAAVLWQDHPHRDAIEPLPPFALP